MANNAGPGDPNQIDKQVVDTPAKGVLETKTIDLPTDPFNQIVGGQTVQIAKDVWIEYITEEPVASTNPLIGSDLTSFFHFGFPTNPLLALPRSIGNMTEAGGASTSTTAMTSSMSGSSVVIPAMTSQPFVLGSGAPFLFSTAFHIPPTRNPPGFVVQSHGLSYASAQNAFGGFTMSTLNPSLGVGFQTPQYNQGGENMMSEFGNFMNQTENQSSLFSSTNPWSNYGQSGSGISWTGGNNVS